MVFDCSPEMLCLASPVYLTFTSLEVPACNLVFFHGWKFSLHFSLPSLTFPVCRLAFHLLVTLGGCVALRELSLPLSCSFVFSLFLLRRCPHQLELFLSPFVAVFCSRFGIQIDVHQNQPDVGCTMKTSLSGISATWPHAYRLFKEVFGSAISEPLPSQKGFLCPTSCVIVPCSSSWGDFILC